MGKNIILRSFNCFSWALHILHLAIFPLKKNGYLIKTGNRKPIALLYSTKLCKYTILSNRKKIHSYNLPGFLRRTRQGVHGQNERGMSNLTLPLLNDEILHLLYFKACPPASVGQLMF